MHQPKDITAFTPGETPAGATRTPFGRIAAGLNRFAEWLTAPVAQKNGRRSTVAVYQAFILMAASLSFALAALLGAAITFAMYSPMDIRPQILTVCAVFYASLPMLRRVGVGLDWEKTLFFTASFTVVFCFGLDPGAMRTAGITTFLPILVGMGAPLYSTFGIAVLAAVALTVSGSLTLIDLARFEPVAGGLTQGEVGMMGVRNIATIVCATIISLFGRQIYEQLILNVKATRDRARRANEMKGAFLANLSHEVRTPLNAIVGLTDILKHKGDLSDQKALLDTISRSGHDLLVTLNDVLDVAQLEAGQMQVRPAPHHMPEFLRNMRHMWQPLIEERGLLFRLDVDPDIPDEVELDAGRLRQCVNNLMSNAAKFTDVGEVHVTLRWHAGDPALLEIEVCDTGIGIPLDRQAHLMQPFEQAVDGTVERDADAGVADLD
ncbi:MAG: histidine kinase dimerization/phospho-acceptor domain-containing protein, partial [Pseudomonadota bacterium]